MVPDRVAPETCARSGVAENTSPRAQIKTRILVAFDFIAVPPVWYKDFSDIQHTHFPTTLGSDEACSMEWTLLFLCRREYQDERLVGRRSIGNVACPHVVSWRGAGRQKRKHSR